MAGRKRLQLAALLVVVLLLVTACAAGPNTAAANPGAHPAGFWLGLWHGVICVITFIISLFDHDVNVYEVRNNGNWYNFGFILGILIMASGGGGGASYRRRR